MPVDLSRSLYRACLRARRRADELRQAGQPAEAAEAYRQAAGLQRRYAGYAFSAAERARRLAQAEGLAALAERPADAAGRETGELSDDDRQLRDRAESFIIRSDVTWERIGGLADVKRQLRLAYGLAVARKPAGVEIDPVRSVLLFGPPGTGKTLLAAAVSGQLGATFFSVGASRLLSKWFGESPRIVSAVYDAARRRAPSVVFIDELEALLSSREAAASGAERRVLATLLTELSGVADADDAPVVFTLGATNAPWLMDEAALSRFARRVYVPLPDADARRAVLEIHLTRRGHELACDLADLVAASDGLSGRQIAHVAARAVEAMVAEANPHLAETAGPGAPDPAGRPLRTRPLRRDHFEQALAATRPDTSPAALRRYRQWQSYGGGA